MIPDLDACLAKYGTLRPRYFLGDKGYDSLENIKHVANLGIVPVIAVRMLTQDEDGRRLYGWYLRCRRPSDLRRRQGNEVHGNHRLDTLVPTIALHAVNWGQALLIRALGYSQEPSYIHQIFARTQ